MSPLFIQQSQVFYTVYSLVSEVNGYIYIRQFGIMYDHTDFADDVGVGMFQIGNLCVHSIFSFSSL